jgi:6-phosphogluconolactonase
MKIAKLACMALMGPLFLTGCSGFWDKPVTPNPPTTLTSGFFYVLNFASSQIAGFNVKAGVTTAVSGSPYTLAAAPIAITVAPNNAFLYVSTLTGIYLYTISTSTGELTLSNSNGQQISADQAASMQVDSTNSWLIEAVTGSPNLFAIHISPTAGTVVSSIPLSVPLPVATIQQIAISPDNSFVYVAMGAGGTAVVQFNANNTNPFGSVVTIPAKSAAGGAISVAVDPITTTTTAPRLFYVGETAVTSGNNTGGLRVFNYSTLQEITGSPFAINGLAPYSILPFSTGNFVYVLNRQVAGSNTGVITGFSIAGSNGTFTLTPLGKTFPVGTNPQSMVEDSSGAFVFAVNFGGSPDLTGYTIDSTNAGYLDAVISSATGTAPVSAIRIAALH